MIEVQRYQPAPPEARAIRTAVFIEEQEFEAEFDEVDLIATHVVLFEDGSPLGTCRVFPAPEEMGLERESVFIVGRVAVLKQARGKHYGALLMKEAGKVARDLGGSELWLHSQIQAQGFYEKQGFVAFGPIELDEGVEHIWMKKELKESDLN